MEEDTIFLTKVSQLFLENGAKTLTMDDIAKAFGISKKTLYVKYKNKEELIEEVLHFKLEEIITRLKYLDQTIENAIERMFCRDEEMDNVADANNTILIKQLIKYYPAIFNKHMIEFSDKFAEVLVHNIEKGREQGLYRTNFDAEVYSKLFFQLLMSMQNPLYVDPATINKAHYKHEIMSMYMNAITNEKGKEILNKIKY
ncbi:TetR/AcrR family transcriptional regulator [Chryseobacterium gotjawalense]|uniref:TetR/AcrR family transcriptional regulator n=1 Tax=Chryseobacterium gotjawalense TaxID=3042315 RepID=A0ABY8RG11_9FLAO|nr:TetR/AcrR family transcriptional regulator [Chryseobacterium sp. wdc7]WHF52167.1 TetR/AcrR family transcriptional regulator [Chryseobacterium sp. wdc7]